MSRARRKPPPRGLAHYGAPAAFLVAVTVAVLLVHNGLQHQTPTTTTLGPATTTAQAVSTTTGGRQPRAKSFYTVQTGDTFGSIASKEGITVAQLQSLNPGVSSNALQVGQKLRVK